MPDGKPPCQGNRSRAGVHWGTLYEVAQKTGKLPPCCAPIHDGDNRFLRVVGFDLRKNVISDKLETDSPYFEREFLVDDEGMVVVHSDMSRGETDRELPPYPNVVKGIQAGSGPWLSNEFRAPFRTRDCGQTSRMVRSCVAVHARRDRDVTGTSLGLCVFPVGERDGPKKESVPSDV